MTDLLTIGLMGDVMLGRTLNDVISQHGYNYPWGNIIHELKHTDLNVINLETTLTNSEKMVYKTFNFKSTPDKVHSLTHSNVTVANLANNHILDFSQEGLLETIKTLDLAGIKHTGAGKNWDEAITPAIVFRNNISVGVLGLTDNEPGWRAGHGPGTSYVDLRDSTDRLLVLQCIERLQKAADIIVVSIHWGPNMQEKPAPLFINFAHEMVEQGAHIIHGHSAHILQGIECYHSGLILYDTGDFVDDYAVDPDLRNDLSALFIATAGKSGVVNLQLIPVRIFQYQVNRARQQDYAWVINRLNQLSSPFGTHIDGQGKIAIRPATNN